MNNKRLFLALELSEESKQQINHWRAQHLAVLQGKEQKAEKKPIPLDNYHITLVFLGATSPADEAELTSQLRQLRQLQSSPFKAEAFDLHLDKTAYWLKPKLIYLAPSHVPPALLQLQQTVHNIVKTIGLPTESRPYQPHVSLYRKISPSLFQQLEQAGLPLPDVPLAITHFALYQSVSGVEAGVNGVTYPVVERFGLGIAPGSTI